PFPGTPPLVSLRTTYPGVSKCFSREGKYIPDQLRIVILIRHLPEGISRTFNDPSASQRVEWLARSLLRRDDKRVAERQVRRALGKSGRAGGGHAIRPARTRALRSARLRGAVSRASGLPSRSPRIVS